jgi:hypothetical protein
VHPPPAKWNLPPPPAPPSPPTPVAALAPVAALLVAGTPPAPPLPLLPVTVKQLPATQIPALPEALHGAPSSRDRTTQSPFAVASQRRVSQTPSPLEGQIFGDSAPHLSVAGSHVGATRQASVAAPQVIGLGAAQRPVAGSHAPAIVHAAATGHASGVDGLHTPLDGSHVPATMQGLAGAQIFGGCAHAPPLHRSSVQLTPSTHAPAGAGPFSGVHAPSLDAPLDFAHAWHAPPLHAESQQTPSAQNPVWHSDELPHVVPIGSFATQLRALQYPFGKHGVSSEQVIMQTVPLHPGGPHGVDPPVLQVPLPSHTEGPMALPPAHEPGPQG